MSAPRGWVFRDHVAWIDGATLAAEVARDLRAAKDEAGALRALLSAAALEGALADAGHAGGAALTDRIAAAYLRRDGAELAPPGAGETPAGPLRVSRPEGFAYYAVVPRAVADAAAGLQLGSPVTVVGVRTIGVALSAVVAAALGWRAQRFTVRPEGSPFDRATRLDEQQVAAVRRRAGGWFVVVDEGPGLSGSSLLSVAEALVAAGAAPERVMLLGTRHVDPSALVAPRAAERWARFRAVAATPPPRDGVDFSGGAWRAHFWRDRARWPITWPALERDKWLSPDGRWLLKFEGLGAYGDVVHARAQALAREGLGPAPAGPPDGSGVVAYPFPVGTPLEGAASADVLATIGRTCAARARLFPVEDVDVAELSRATRDNVALEVGVRLPENWQLPCERPAIVDGRMLPHEWLRAPGGALLKSDGAAHGDDHLLPGPTDVAWDLAGAIVEWQLDAPARRALLAAYRAAAGEDAAVRVRPYEVAYAAFRACACGMAKHTAPGEEARLDLARRRYRRALRTALYRRS
jgi:hypothetical protein